LRAAKIGSSSVTYEIGLFRNAETAASAQGSFVHVYVDEKKRRPVSISDRMKEKLKSTQPLSVSKLNSPVCKTAH